MNASGLARALWGGEGRRRYHFHFPGLLYVLVTLLIAVGAINSQNNLLFAALGLAIGGMLVSGIISGSVLMGVRVSRVMEEQACVGRPLRFRYLVRNSNRLIGAFGLHVEEQASRGTNWESFFSQPSAFVSHVEARDEALAQAEVVPQRRGVVSLGPVQVWSKFPFGLARKSVTFALPHTMIVQPADLPLRPGAVSRLTARAPYGVGGERSAGMGEEFFSLREYAQGDNPRLIAWKRSARTGTLIVRQQAAPAPTRLWVVLRFAPGREGRPGDDERAIALAAAVLREAASQQVAVGLAAPAAGLLQPPRLGEAHLRRLLGELAVLDLDAMRTAPKTEKLPERAGRAGACVVIHGAPVDETYGPRSAVHWDAAEPGRYFAKGVEVERVLALMDVRGDGAGPGRGLVRRVVRTLRRWGRTG
jgi:uncharacterized protein (DUF58 family)